MALFEVNTHRFDPYRNFKFTVKVDGNQVLGCNKCSALTRTTEMVEFRVGGDPSHSRKLPGKTSYAAITLEQGLTFDTTFQDWANKVNNFAGDSAMSLKDFRKDIVIQLRNLQGVVVMEYNVYRCWVSEFQALPELDASANSVCIQSIKLEHEGWERNMDVKEAKES